MKKGLVSEIQIVKKDHLTDLADHDYWLSAYGDPESDSEKIKWDVATSDVMAECRVAGFYNPDRIRGRGVWMEGDNVIVNTGKEVLCNGVKRVEQGIHSEYIYSRGATIDLSYSGHIANIGQSAKLFEIFSNMPIESNTDRLLLAGWCFIASVAGGLEWRPHLWLNAPAGSGKSWLFNNVFSPLFGNIALKVMGEETTEAGIRQAIKADAVTVIHEEAEAHSEKGKRNIEAKLMLARQSSTETEAKVFKGTIGGRSMSFSCRSQFMFISTSMPVLNRADASRISVIRLVASSERKNGKEQFEKLSSLVKGTITKEYCSSVRTRAIHFLPKIREASKVFNPHICDKVQSQRNADQYSPMVAGAWFLINDHIPSDVECEIFLSGFEFPVYDPTETEEQKCIDTILSMLPREWESSMTICDAIARTINGDDLMKPKLEQLGIGYSKKHGAIHFKANNVVLSSILREKGSQYYATYLEELSRLNGAKRNEVHNYSGRVCRGVYVPIESLNISTDHIASQEVQSWFN